MHISPVLCSLHLWCTVLLLISLGDQIVVTKEKGLRESHVNRAVRRMEIPFDGEFLNLFLFQFGLRPKHFKNIHERNILKKHLGSNKMFHFNKSKTLFLFQLYLYSYKKNRKFGTKSNFRWKNQNIPFQKWQNASPFPPSEMRFWQSQPDFTECFDFNRTAFSNGTLYCQSFSDKLCMWS